MNTLPFGRVAGVSIRIHVSWIILLALLVVSVASQVGVIDPDAGQPVKIAIGIAVAFGFLLSAVAHDLAHVLVARRSGVAVRSVTVFFLGAAAVPRIETSRPRDEIAAALAGPLTSLALGGVLLLVATAGELIGTGLSVTVGRVALVIGTLDIAIGLLNLLPAYPLDGGRVVHAIAWSRQGDPRTSMRTAAKVGRACGLVVAAVGVVVILLLEPVDGLMIALGGWFIASNARVVERRSVLDAVLDGLTVADVMERAVSTVPPGLTIDTFAEQVLGGGGAMALPVVRGAEVLGLIDATQLRRIRRGRWATLRVEDVMMKPPRLPLLAASGSIQGVIDDLARTNLEGLPVVEGGLLTGIVLRRTVADMVRARAEAAGVHPW